ncbi:hypothetical protein ABZ863_22990 [Saccharomonospora sp. NPDC046836]|uniref:hypothetical protein n=1 Tax=Saccharomonospora sp. NPDC046836 TaxID=3156921 RepID=UPI0033CD168A
MLLPLPSQLQGCWLCWLRAAEVHVDAVGEVLADGVGLWALPTYPQSRTSQSHAAYVALAEQLGGILITCDAKLAAASGARCTFDLIA